MGPIALLELYTDVEEIRRNPQKRPIKNPKQNPAMGLMLVCYTNSD